MGASGERSPRVDRPTYPALSVALPGELQVSRSPSRRGHVYNRPVDDIELGTIDRVDHFSDHERTVSRSQEPVTTGTWSWYWVRPVRSQTGGSSGLSLPHGWLEGDQPGR